MKFVHTKKSYNPYIFSTFFKNPYMAMHRAGFLCIFTVAFDGLGEVS